MVVGRHQSLPRKVLPYFDKCRTLDEYNEPTPIRRGPNELPYFVLLRPRALINDVYEVSTDESWRKVFEDIRIYCAKR